MKRTPLIILLVVVGLLIVGGIFFLQSGGVEKAKQQVTQKVQEGVVNAVSMECTFTDQGRETKAYIKSGMVRSDYTGTTPQESGSVLFRDKVLYSWNAQKQGFKMTVPEVTGTVPDVDPQQAPAMFQMEEMMNYVNKYKDSCKPAVLSDDLFTVPTDVTFTDYSQMQEQFQNMQNGANAPSIDPAQMQQMMQEYQ